MNRKDGNQNLNAAILVARPEYVYALDRIMLATNHTSRIRLIETALKEYAERRGFSMPTRLAGTQSRYVHALDE